MRPPLALLALVLLALSLNACGDASKGSSSDSTTQSGAFSIDGAATSTTNVQRDKDGDRDDPTNSFYDSDDNPILHYGRAASPAEKLEIETLVKRYYAVALAADGSTGCSLMSATTAESVVELYGDDSADPALHGNTCAVVLSKLFTQHHQQLSEELPTLKVTSVRVGNHIGWALLSSGSPQIPGRMLVYREGTAAWKIGEVSRSTLS